MSNVRKSLHRSANLKRAKWRANQRAAKEWKRLETVAREEPMPDTSECYTPKISASGFRITVECLDDGERASFTTSRGPHGLTVSATTCGERIRMLLQNYEPIKRQTT